MQSHMTSNWTLVLQKSTNSIFLIFLKIFHLFFFSALGTNFLSNICIYVNPITHVLIAEMCHHGQTHFCVYATELFPLQPNTLLCLPYETFIRFPGIQIQNGGHPIQSKMAQPIFKITNPIINRYLSHPFTIVLKCFRFSN